MATSGMAPKSDGFVGMVRQLAHLAPRGEASARLGIP